MSCSRHAGCEKHQIGSVSGCTECRAVCAIEHDGDNAFGKKVPTVRQVSALDTAVEILGVEATQADPIIRVTARFIELDKPFNALMTLQNIVDLTGAYRLLAVLCTEDGSE